MRLGLDFQVGISQWAYWQSRVEGISDRETTGKAAQFRAVRFQTEFGARWRILQAFYWHHSDHDLDHAEPFGFPVEDGAGIRLRFFGAPDR